MASEAVGWDRSIIDKFLRNRTTQEEEHRLLDYNEVDNEHFGIEETAFNGEPDYNYTSSGIYNSTSDISVGEGNVSRQRESIGSTNERNPNADGLRRRGGTRGSLRISPSEGAGASESVASGVGASVGAVSSASAVGAGSSLAAPTLLASAAIGTAAVGIGGYLTEKIANRRGYTLPGSDYVGPGNSIPIEAAKNPVDQIARDHDLKYQEIQEKYRKGQIDKSSFVAEVKEADREAATRFAEESGIHAAIGKVGLDVKQTIEKLTGVLYPSVPGKI